MPRLRTTAVRKRRSIEISDLAYAYMIDDPDYERHAETRFDLFAMLHLEHPTGRGDEPRRIWDAVRDEIMSWWPERHPGTRPKAWWRLDAPRWDDPWEGWYCHGTFAEPRRRLGGKGTPIYECLNYV